MVHKEIDIPIVNIMHENVITASVDESAQVCALKMTEERVGCIIILDDEVPVGIITERGFADLVKQGNFDSTEVKARDFMSVPLITIDSNANYSQAIEVFGEEDVKRLPVVEGDKVIGLLTLKNMVEYSRLTIDLLHKENKVLQNEVNIDGLTGVYNKAAIEELLEVEFERLETEGGRSTMLFIDIDHFKSINDTYSHLAGDEVLKELSELLKNTCRDTDLIGRFGGEEFIIIGRNQKQFHGLGFSERLRKIIEEHPFRFKDEEIAVTVSVGMTSLFAGQNLTEAVEHADLAMYHAKQNGRNCVGFWEKGELSIYTK